MSNIVLIFVCLSLGLILQRIRSLPKDAHVVLNQIILFVPLPAIALVNIPFIEWNMKLLSLCLMPWLTFIVAYSFFSFVGKKFFWSPSLIGCFILTAGLGNTSFVGFPIIEAVFGKEAIPYAVLIDQPGTFLICSTLGIYLASHFAHGKMPMSVLIKKVATFPFFIAFAVALLMSAAGLRPGGEFKILLERLASLLTPLALISVGLQLKWGDVWAEKRHLFIGLYFKLILVPLLVMVVYRGLGLPDDIYKVVVLEAAMAPMITSSILAATHGLEPRLAGMMVGVGIPVSFLTLAGWYFVL